MASKKRKKKIANEGGYNWERNNAHIQRKNNKVKLKCKTCGGTKGHLKWSHVWRRDEWQPCSDCTDKAKVCPRCKGTGQMQGEAIDGKAGNIVKCHKCKGTGKSE